MEEGAYLTIAATSEGFYKNKGSKFHAYAHKVYVEEEVKELVKQYKKDYHDARHHCYGFVIGENGDAFRAGDDGEPSNSAGAPILGQIRSKDLSNVCVIVVRYFGGTKLGVPGLIEAYKTSAEEALNNAEIITEHVSFSLELKFTYEEMNTIMKVIKDFDLPILKQEFEMTCYLKTRVKKSDWEAVTSLLENFIE